MASQPKRPRTEAPDPPRETLRATSPTLPAEMFSKILEFVPFKSLQKCKAVSKTFEYLVDREIRRKRRFKYPQYFSWVGGEKIGKHSLRDYEHFHSEAHVDLYEHFEAFVESLMFEPCLLIAISSGKAEELMDEFKEAFDPFERRSSARMEAKMEAIVDENFVINIEEIADILDVAECEVVSVSCRGTILQPDPERSLVEPVCFSRTRRPTFCCVAFPRMEGVTFHAFEKEPLFDPAPPCQQQLAQEIELSGELIPRDDVKCAVLFGCHACMGIGANILNETGVDHVSCWGDLARLSTRTRSKARNSLDVFLGRRPIDLRDWYWLENPVGVVFEGPNVVHAHLTLEFGDTDDRKTRVEAEFRACKNSLEESAPEGTTRFFAFMSASSLLKSREELDEDIRAFRDVFPDVPVLGSLDCDRFRVTRSKMEPKRKRRRKSPPELTEDTLAEIFGYLPFRQLEKCKLVSKQFKSAAERELNSARRRNVKPAYFSWASRYMDDDREYLRDFDHFKSDAHLEVKRKFNAFMDKLMFAPRYMIALTTGLGFKLQKRLREHYWRKLLAPFEDKTTRAVNKIVKKYFFIDMNDIIPVLNVKRCEVISCDAQGAVISPKSGKRKSDEIKCISFERHGKATFSCFLLPDKDGVILRTYQRIPLFTPVTQAQKNLVDNARKGRKFKRANAKFAIHFGCQDTCEFADNIFESCNIEFLSFRGSYTRLWGAKQTTEYLDIFRGLRPYDSDEVVRAGDSVGIVFEGENVFHAYVEIGPHEPEDRPGFRLQLEACKASLNEQGPNGANLIAFLSTNLEATHKSEIRRKIDAFSEVFPGVPIMGNLDHDSRHFFWELYPRIMLLIVGFT